MRTSLSILVIVLACFGMSGCKEELCNDTCYWPADGVCDDGGEDAAFDACEYGTDCTDCGPRKELD